MSQRFGRYEILASLGAGGMGEVSLAREHSVVGDERLVALKIILPELATTERFVELLAHEAAIVARLSHPNIVRIHRLGEIEGRYFIAMELVKGASLADLLGAAAKKNERIPLGACVGAVMQACAGAHAAHELRDERGAPLGLVHRDISPHNVMVDEHGVVKLLDFGVALLSAREDVDPESIIGKPAYLSPEQANATDIDRRADIFALGTVLWELLAVQKRFPGKNARAIIVAIAKGEGPSLREVRPDLPPALYDVVARALAFRREDRFHSAAELSDALAVIARELGFDTDARALAAVMGEHVGERIAERTLRVSAFEQSALTVMSADEPTVIEPRAPSSSGRRVAAIPLDMQLPGIARARNWELSADPHLALCRVWSVPEMSREEGAASAQNLLQQVLRVLTDVPARRGFIFDVRDARMVIGGKTLAVLETMFATAEDRGVRIAALIANDPLQKLDFADLIERAAPRCGAIFDEASHALRYASTAER